MPESPEVIAKRREQVEGLVKKHGLSTKQRTVLSRLVVGGQKPQQIAKAMKISVNGVYGHMRRIESAGVDLAQFRSRNGSSTKTRKRSRSKNRNGVVHTPGVMGFLKSLDDSEAKLQKEDAELAATIEGAKKTLTDAEARGVEVENALLGIKDARQRVEPTR